MQHNGFPLKSIFSHSSHLSLRLPDGAAKIFISIQFFPTTLYRGAGKQTHVSRVAPDWDLCGMLYRLSYSAAAIKNRCLAVQLVVKTCLKSTESAKVWVP